MRAPAFAAILSGEGFILVTNIQLNMASPESSLHVRALKFPPSNFSISYLPFKTPSSLKRSFADSPRNRAWINTSALMINESFPWMETCCSTGSGILESAFQRVHGQQEHHALCLWMDHRGAWEALPVMRCGQGEHRRFLSPQPLFPCSSSSSLGVRFSQLARHFTDKKK